MIALAVGDEKQKPMSHDELILFYRVKDLEQFNFEVEDQALNSEVQDSELK